MITRNDSVTLLVLYKSRTLKTEKSRAYNSPAIAAYSNVMDWTGIVFLQKMLLAFFTVILCVGSETISEDRFLSEQQTRLVKIWNVVQIYFQCLICGFFFQSGFALATYAYTAIGWNHTDIKFSIIQENLDCLKTVPKFYNASV